MNREQRSALIAFVILDIVVVVGLVWYFAGRAGRLPESERAPLPAVVSDPLEAHAPVDTSAWNLYESRTFGFSILVPPDWKVREGALVSGAPSIHVFSADTPTDSPRFQDGPAGISAYMVIAPQGGETEPVYSISHDLDVGFLEMDTESSIDYVLADGMAWASLIRLKEMPDRWNQNAFIWMQAPVADVNAKCFRTQIEVPMATCEPDEGDEIVYYGILDEKSRRIQLAILRSFTLLENSE